jgi:hypothetical protein
MSKSTTKYLHYLSGIRKMLRANAGEGTNSPPPNRPGARHPGSSEKTQGTANRYAASRDRCVNAASGGAPR